MILHAYLNSNTEIIVAAMTLFSSTKQGDSDLFVEDEYEVRCVIFEFLGIFIRRGLTTCLDLLFHQSVQNISLSLYFIW